MNHPLANLIPSIYAEPVSAKSLAGVDSPQPHRRTGAAIRVGAFLLPAFDGGCAWESERAAGFLCGRSVNPRTVTALRLTARRWLQSHRSHTMTISNRKARAAAHRQMAYAVLRANSSRSVREKRFHDHMAKARALEATPYLVRATFHYYAHDIDRPRVAYYGIHGMEPAAPLVPFASHSAARDWIAQVDGEVYLLGSNEHSRPTLIAVPITMAPAHVQDQLEGAQ